MGWWQFLLHVYQALSAFRGSLPDNSSVPLGSLPVYGVHTSTGLKVPEFEIAVQRSAEDPGRVKLETGDCVVVSFQGHATPAVKGPHLAVMNESKEGGKTTVKPRTGLHSTIL